MNHPLPCRTVWLTAIMGTCLWGARGTTAEVGPRVVVEPGGPESAEVAVISHKLETLVIPKVEFRETPLSDALEFLRAEARRVDSGPEEARGINIFLKLPGVKPGEAAQPRPISLSMEHPTLGEALRAVAAKAGMKVKVESYAVSMVPVTENTETLYTAEVQEVPPGFFGGESEENGADGKGPARVNALEELEKRGMTFPPGCSAVYLPEKHKLIVRETAANIDLLKKIFGGAGASQK